MILTLVCALTIALILGFVVQKINLSPIVGYLIAGVLVSPYSPGVVADINITQQFAEIG
ncbi:MAG: cation:proton antiporter, partial [Elusimicrobia bacterium]|nr:cation:proton antiporter [Elusimicrobiota bacterium]